MAERIEKSWVDPNFGELREKGGDGSGNWLKKTFGKPNGLVDPGETLVINRVKYELTESDVASLDVFIKQKTGASDVDFVRDSNGTLAYIVYRKNGQLSIIDRASKSNVFSLKSTEAPESATNITAYYNKQFPIFDANADVGSAIALRNAYKRFLNSVQSYTAEINDYRQDFSAFMANANPNAGDVKSILDRTSAYNNSPAVENYYRFKQEFYGVHSVKQWENPDYNGFKNDYDQKAAKIVAACDAQSALNLQTGYALLLQSAQFYAAQVNSYRAAAHAYLQYDNPTQQQTWEFQQSQATYTNARQTYQNAKNTFYNIQATLHYSTPQYWVYSNDYSAKNESLRRNCDWNNVSNLESAYDNLSHSAQNYESNARDFQSDIARYLRLSAPNSGDNRGLQIRANDFENVASYYRNDHNNFYRLVNSGLQNYCPPPSQPPRDDNTDDDPYKSSPTPSNNPPKDNNTDDDPYQSSTNRQPSSDDNSDNDTYNP